MILSGFLSRLNNDDSNPHETHLCYLKYRKYCMPDIIIYMKKKNKHIIFRQDYKTNGAILFVVHGIDKGVDS